MSEKEKTNLKAVKYIDTLSKEAKERYMIKIDELGGRDPYQIAAKEWDFTSANLPPTDYGDLYNYLVLGQSAYTQQEFKSFKSLTAYKHFVAGWVSDVATFSPPDSNSRVVIAKVLHSQRLSEKALRPWAIIQPDGVIKSAHCTCMAGIGETCSHVAAMLFWVDFVVRSQEKTTVTQEKAYWKVPAFSRQLLYAKLKDINFQAASTKKRTAEAMLQGEKPPNNKFRQQVIKTPPAPTPRELWSLAAKCVEKGLKPAFLSAMPEYAHLYKPPVLPENVPPSLRSLKDDACKHMNYSELLEHSKNTVLPRISLTKQQIECAEKRTRNQSDCKLWHSLRAGRVTASNFHDIVHTDMCSPALSLIKKVCYPERNRFTSVATSWGIENEVRAQEKYISMMEKTHSKFQFERNGLVLNEKFPFMGASPDGICSCQCHPEKWCVEIKCPYKHANADSLLEACQDHDFCLLIDSQDGSMRLKKKHRFYSQVQCQLFITGFDFCHVVIFLPSDIHVEKILPDLEFWMENYPKAEHIFCSAILPELVACFFSDNESQCSEETQKKHPLSPSKMNNAVHPRNSNDDIWCYCRKDVTSEKMIGCDNENCKIQWFHCKCLGITKIPRGKWFCPDCRKILNQTQSTVAPTKKRVKCN